MRVETVDMSEYTRRMDEGIYDPVEFDAALAWARANCREGADRNPTELFYDALGRKLREEDLTTGTTRLYYNGLGELRRGGARPVVRADLSRGPAGVVRDDPRSGARKGAGGSLSDC